LVFGLFFLILAGAGNVPSALGQDARISELTAGNSESHLLLYLTVSDWFTDDMEAAIHNGIPITFAFRVELLAKRPNWPDRTMREYELSHVLEYDSLKEEYQIRRVEKGDTRIISVLADARKLMSEINGFEVIPLDELDPQETYILRTKARLARKTMPLYFHYLIPFSSPWDFKTDWHELKLRLAQ
jgi:hypothetical protein